MLYPMVRNWSANLIFGLVNTSVKPLSNLVKVGQTSPNSRKCDPGPILRVFKYGWPPWGQFGWVQATSFCVLIPKKIPGVKIGLWQLPLLFLAFLGTRNVGQRIKWLNFCSLGFSRFSCPFTVVAQFASVCVPIFLASKQAFQGQRRLDGVWKGGAWHEVALRHEKQTHAASPRAGCDGAVRGPTLNRAD